MTTPIAPSSSDVAPFLARRATVLRGWANAFRYPESWYSQSDENRRLARGVRESAQRTIATGLRRAREQETAGDVSGASATIAGLEMFAHTLQMVRTRLEDDRSTLSIWVEEQETAALHALEAGARALGNLGSGINETAALFAFGALALWAILR